MISRIRAPGQTRPRGPPRPRRGGDVRIGRRTGEGVHRGVLEADLRRRRADLPPDRGLHRLPGANGPSCGGQPAVPNNAFYCPAGHFIAYDENWMRELDERMGDGSIYVIIPHEFGHAVQAQLNTSSQLNVELELQADCYAGGTLGALVRGGALLAEDGDENELLINLAAAGDPTDDWLRPDAHGTAEQRQAVFVRGYNEGTDVC
ncbi:neutral zinc metallopeptidase [Streptosporangium lutulentum]